MSSIDPNSNLPENIREVINASPFTSKGYKILNLMGEGSFASAYLIQNSNKEKFILKITRKKKDKDDNYDMFDTEIKIYDHLRLEYTDKCKELGLLCLVDNFEVVHNNETYLLTIIDNFGDSDLKQLIRGKKLNLYEKELIIFHLSKNLRLLHDNNIIHKDIKPDNIRVNSESKKKESNFIDYGFSCLKDLDNFEKCRDAKYGSPLYSAPELIHSSELAEKFKDKFGTDVYAKSIDLWSLGILFYNLLDDNIVYVNSLNNAYSDITNYDLIKNWYSVKKEVISINGLYLFKFIILSLIDNPSYRGGFFSKLFQGKKLGSINHLISSLKNKFNLSTEKVEEIITEFNNEIKKYNLENLLILDPEARNLKLFMLSRVSWLEEVIKEDTLSRMSYFKNIEYKQLSTKDKKGIQDLIKQYKEYFVENKDYDEANLDLALTESKNMSMALKSTNYKDQNVQFEIVKAFKEKTFEQKVIKEKIDRFTENFKSIFSRTKPRPITEPKTSDDIDKDLAYLRNNPPNYPPPRLPPEKRKKKTKTIILPPSPKRSPPKRTRTSYLYNQSQTPTSISRLSSTNRPTPIPRSQPGPSTRLSSTYRPTPIPRSQSSPSTRLSSSNKPKPKPRPKQSTLSLSEFGRGKKKTKRNTFKKSVNQKRNTFKKSVNQKRKKKKQKKK